MRFNGSLYKGGKLIAGVAGEINTKQRPGGGPIHRSGSLTVSVNVGKAIDGGDVFELRLDDGNVFQIMVDAVNITQQGGIVKFVVN